MSTSELDIAQSAAVLCPHVATRQAPILFARRDAAAFPEDSGWQFTCGAATGHEDELAAQLWSIDEVLELEPSLQRYMDKPAGTEISRRDATAAWGLSAA